MSLKLHRGQKIVYRDKRRYRVVVAGRRWGKTQTAKTEIITAATRRKKQLVWYVAPTYQMARDILWDDLKDAIPAAYIKRINETRMTIYLINGSRIHLKGADKPDSLRGVGLNFLVIDEAQDIDVDAWEKVLRPTLATTGGRAIIIGTPKSFNWLYDKYIEGQRGDTYIDDKGRKVVNAWKSWQFPTITSPFIPKAEIEQARRDMDPRSFRQEFEASFETMSGRVYYPFDRNVHVGDFPFNPGLPIAIGMDFNLDPMSCVIIQEQSNGEIWVVDEAVLPGSNTEEAGNELMRRYYKMVNSVTIFPDPAGANRTTASRGESDLDVLRDVGFKRLMFKRKHPAIADRVNAVNRLLRTADDSIKLKVNRKCTKVIESLEQTIYKPGTREVDKSLGFEHPTDALGYWADFVHPVRKIKIAGRSL